MSIDKHELPRELIFEIGSSKTRLKSNKNSGIRYKFSNLFTLSCYPIKEEFSIIAWQILWGCYARSV